MRAGRRERPGTTCRVPSSRPPGLVSLVYGFTKASSDGWASRHTLILLSVAVVLLVAFVVVETRSSHPLLPLRVVAERNRGGSYLASFLTGAGLFAMFVFLSYYMQGVLHYSALKAGIAFLPFAVGIIVAAGASSALVPRIGPRIPMTAGLLVGAIGLAWLTQIGVHTSYWAYVFGPEILMSMGLGLAFPALSSTALINVDDKDSGVASALVNTDPADRWVTGHRPAQHRGRDGHGQLRRGPRSAVPAGRAGPRVLGGFLPSEPACSSWPPWPAQCSSTAAPGPSRPPPRSRRWPSPEGGVVAPRRGADEGAGLRFRAGASSSGTGAASRWTRSRARATPSLRRPRTSDQAASMK